MYPQLTWSIYSIPGAPTRCCSSVYGKNPNPTREVRPKEDPLFIKVHTVVCELSDVFISRYDIVDGTTCVCGIVYIGVAE